MLAASGPLSYYLVEFPLSNPYLIALISRHLLGRKRWTLVQESISFSPWNWWPPHTPNMLNVQYPYLLIMTKPHRRNEHGEQRRPHRETHKNFRFLSHTESPHSRICFSFVPVRRATRDGKPTPSKNDAVTNKIVVRAAVVRVEGTRRRVHAHIGHAVVRLVPAGQDEAVLVLACMWKSTSYGVRNLISTQALAVAAVPLVVAAGGC